jgi:hypothetical protein
VTPLIVVLWRDLFVILDRGGADPAEYGRVAGTLAGRSAAYPAGMGGVTIIPAGVRPPSDAVRAAIRDVLHRLDGRLRSFAWVVEGEGFEGALVRAVLTGLRVMTRHSYPTHVASNLQAAVAWTLPHLAGGVARLADVPLATRAITMERTAAGIVTSS